MKITIPRASLLAAIAQCDEVAKARSSVPAHACVAIDAGSAAITLRATNGYQSISCRADGAEITTAGAVLVRSHDFRRRVEALTDGEVRLSVIKNQLEAKQGATRLTVGVFPADEVPTFGVPPVGGEDVDVATLVELLDRLGPVASTDESPATSHAVYLLSDGARLTARAVSSVYGARASLPYAGTIDALIPLPAVNHLRKALRKHGGQARMSVVGPTLWVTFGETSYSTQLPAGSAPHIDNVMPPRHGRHLAVDRLAMLDALKAAKLVAVGDSVPNRVRLRALPGQVFVCAQNVGGETVSQPVASDGALENCSANSDQLIGALSFFESDEVEIWQADRSSALLVCEPGGDGWDAFVMSPVAPDQDDMANESALVTTEAA